MSGRSWTKQAIQRRPQPDALARRLVQRDVLHVVALHPAAELGDLGQRDDRVAVAIRRQAG